MDRNETEDTQKILKKDHSKKKKMNTTIVAIY